MQFNKKITLVLATALVVVPLLSSAQSFSNPQGGSFFQNFISQFSRPKNTSATPKVATTPIAPVVGGTDEAQVSVLTDALMTEIAAATKTGNVAGAFTKHSPTQIARKRAKHMELLAQKDPEAFLRNVIAGPQRAKLPSAAQESVEQKVTIKGIMEVLHEDDFKNPKNSKFRYWLRSGAKRYSFSPAGEAPPISSGSVVSVSGYKIGETVVASGDAGIDIDDPEEPDTVGEQQTLFVLVTGPGKPATPTAQQMADEIFTGAFEHFYEEQSYGKTSFDGDVTDWISVSPAPNGVCLAIDWNNPTIKEYIETSGIDLSKYERVVYVMNGGQGGCAYVGKIGQSFGDESYNLSVGWVGYPSDAYHQGDSEMSGFGYVLAHEMGHELGVMHANAWSCSSISYTTNCYHSEYGNSFDTMGTGFFGGHFNAFYKDFLGWLPAQSKIAITESGQYTLSPLEQSSGVRAAIVSNPSHPHMDPIYLELRQQIGFDRLIPASSAGIHINQIAQDLGFALPMTRLLNANQPGGQPALMPGGSFNHSSLGIRIGRLSIASSTAVFDVDLSAPRCEPLGISADDLFFSEVVPAGSSGYLTVLLVNRDSEACKPSTIKVTSTITDSDGWGIYPYPQSDFSLSPGESQYYSVTFVPPADAPRKSYTITATIENSNASSTSVVQRTFSVVNPPKIDSIVPTSGRTGSQVLLRGTDFNTGAGGNRIYIVRGNLFAYTDVTTVQSDQVYFTFPTTFEDTGGKGTKGVQFASAPAQDGPYDIYLSRLNDGGFSNPAQFTVSSTTQKSDVFLTVNGKSRVVVAVGDTVTYEWGAKGATSTRSTYTIDAPTTCGGESGSTGPFPWIATSTKGTRDLPATLCQAGRTYTITYTVKNAVGVEESAMAIVEVQKATAEFTATPLSGSSPLTTIFTWKRGASCEPGLYELSYGDGYTDTIEVAPECSGTTVMSHTYERTGTFNAFLSKSSGFCIFICIKDKIGSATVTATAGRIDGGVKPRGVLDVAQCSTVQGWVQDEDTPDKATEVHFYVDDWQGAGGMLAAEYRSDLCEAFGSCVHGFSASIPEQFRDGKPHQFHAYGIDTTIAHTNNVELGGSPKTFQCGDDLQGTTRPRGVLDAVTCTAFEGWAQDPDTPDRALEVHIYIDGAIAGGTHTDISRPDVNAAFNIGGTHGFTFLLPAKYMDGKSHTVNVYAIDSTIDNTNNAELSNSGKTFRCSAASSGDVSNLASALAAFGAFFTGLFGF